MDFIENKSVKWREIEDIMRVSREQNHYANYGPVVRDLEFHLKHILNIPETYSVVVINNATTGLQVGARFHQLNCEKKSFKWVVSAFNFYSARIGAFADSTLIDSTQIGSFNLPELKRVPLDQYDGVLYTNMFAQHTDWRPVEKFCIDNKKAFVVDNAVGLFDRPDLAHRGIRDPYIEIISAHHTKPWGFGECGIAIVSRNIEDKFRALINFGKGLSPKWRLGALNGKASDIMAAGVLSRLYSIDSWAQTYHEQRSRLLDLLPRTFKNISPLIGMNEPRSPVAHTPFMVSRGFVDEYATRFFPIKKYYQPIWTEETEQFVNAQTLFSKVFSLPNTNEIAKLTDEKLISGLVEYQGVNN